MIHADDIQAARDDVQAAASKSYDAFTAAKVTLAKLERQYEEQEAATAGVSLDETVAVVGATYAHRRALKALGLRWEPGYQAWIGTRRQARDLPAGCYVRTVGQAALASMDHADSIV